VELLSNRILQLEASCTMLLLQGWRSGPGADELRGTLVACV
jgi:hypothetical protein